MRDKLIELLEILEQEKALIPDERAADFLIANGVTMQQWISVSERLPEIGGYYFVHHKGGLVSERRFYEEAPELFIPFGNEPVTHWMPLPKPPKENANDTD